MTEKVFVVILEPRGDLAYDNFYKAYISEDFELTTFKSCAKAFNTKKEIKYYCKVMKIPSKDLKIEVL